MKRSKHSLSHSKLLSGNMGKLIPIANLEILPGDSIQAATSLLLRCSPLLAPVMHPVDVRIHHWFVPNRLVMDDWEPFITGGPDGLDNTDFPYIANGVGFAVGSLADYLGIPPAAVVTKANALPFRAYALIYNEFYRDQDLQAELVIDKTSGLDATTNLALQSINWEKDLFTMARPWTQKGAEVSIPLGTSADVVEKGGPASLQFDSPALDLNVRTAASGGGSARALAADDIGGVHTLYETSGSGLEDAFIHKPAQSDSETYANMASHFEADLSGATAATINALREAFAIQSYEEARARYGSRYTEYLRYLGIKPSDARLQRPEYLGGGKQTIQFSEVLQTAEGTDPVGTMRGHGIAGMRSNRFRRFFEEHGTLLTLMSVRPKTMYTQGLAKSWSRFTKEDFFQKELEHIGQEEIYMREVYLPSATPDAVLGYGDRYDQYRRQESSIAGEFRTVLDHWHMARIFAGGGPALNSAFVTCDPTTRIFESTATDQLLVMAKHSIQARRLVSNNATPSTLGR